MVRAEVVDLTVICQGFPEEPQSQIWRDNLLDTIETIFEGDTQVVVIEGIENIGKTTLVSQFAKRHPNHTISLFIKPTSRWTYDPGILRLELCSQLEWVINRRLGMPRDADDDSVLSNRLYELQRRARRNRERFYFVVDGLNQIPEENGQIRQLILDMLPIGFMGCRFIFTGNVTHLLERSPFKTFPLPSFTLDDTVRYFADLSMNRESIAEIHQLCKGVPGSLASMRRILQSGTDIQSLLNQMPDTIPDLFEIEWRHVKEENQNRLLAVVAHDHRRHTINDLACLFNINPDSVQQLLNPLGFLVIDAQSGHVSFVSESFRKFAQRKLYSLKNEVTDLLIGNLLANPDSEVAVTYLPGYLEQAGRFEDLLNYLSPEHFYRTLEHSQSLSPVRQMMALGVDGAKKLNRDGDLIQFSIQKSAITELDRVDIWRSEIEAHMALNNYDSAVALAQSSILTEDRLHLLAVIARIKRKQGLAPEPELIEQIRQLYSKVDYTIIGDRAIEIASDLIYSNPDLAIDLVEKASNTYEGENALDWAFATLSIAAFDVKQQHQQPSDGFDTVENVRLRIKDPSARRFSSAVSLLLGEYSPAEVIAEAEKLEEVGDRLYLLRQWATANREREDALDVVEYALKLSIRTTAYAPNARVLRELATPLPFASDESKIKRLVGTFDGQQGTVERLGPTEDYVRLQLALAQAESRYDLEAARNRVVDIYLYIVPLEDLAIKTGCLARLVSAITEMDPQMIFEVKDGLHTLATDDLRSCTNNLLNSSAEHYLAIRRVVRALAGNKPDIAIEFIRSLNTQARRDLALFDLIDSALKMPSKRIDLGFLIDLIAQISEPELIDQSAMKIIERLSLASNNFAKSQISRALLLIESIYNIRDAGERCRAYCLAYTFLNKQNDDKCLTLASRILRELKEAWEAIDMEWHKVNIGFKIAESLATYSLETARQYVVQTERVRDNITIDSSSSALTYKYCLRLAIRAFSGLLPKHLDTPEDIESLADLINQIPSSGERAQLWGELALRYYTYKRSDDCKDIVVQRIRPLLQTISSRDEVYRSQIIISTAPALYCGHQNNALVLISQLSVSDRDEAYNQICTFILHKKPPSDPYDVCPGQGYDITYDEILDLCKLLELIDLDERIYYFVVCIVDSMVSSRRRASFTKRQRLDVATQLERIIEAKLPNPRHIQHEGYKIAAQSQVARIRPRNWEVLIQSAMAIPNLADRVYVLCIIALSMPSSEAMRCKKVLEDAKGLIQQIPSPYDKIDRYEYLASMSNGLDAALSRECLRLAMKSAVESDNPELYPIQRKIIDLAFRMDSNLAASLASLVDDDPATAQTYSKLKRRLQVLELKDRMIEESSECLNNAANNADYPQAAWMLLAALNAGRITTVHIEHTREYVQVAADLPLNESYPILAWAIENAVRRYSSTDHANTFLRPMFEATLIGARLAAKIAARSSMQLRRTKRYVKSSRNASVLIKSGQREGAMQFLKDWLLSEVRDYLKICDPYFGPDDLEVLQLVRSIHPSCRVHILTSKKHQDQQRISAPWDEAYRNYWRVHVSDHDPPDTDIVIVGSGSGGELPIHDRWWLTNGRGIRMGTSFNSMGYTRDSEISNLSKEETDIREHEVDQYLKCIKREHKGEKIQYWLFTL